MKTATSQITATFNNDNKPRISAPEAGLYLRGEWGASEMSSWIGKLLQPYYEAVSAKTDFGGKDPLVAMGQDRMLRRFLNGGTGIPQRSLDDLLSNMVETGSLEGVKICREAGADPYSCHSLALQSNTAMDLAQSAGRDDMVNAMTAEPTRSVAPLRSQPAFAIS